MKEILIKVSKETRMVDLTKSVIGNDGENLQGKLIFTFIDEFVNGQARLEYEIKGNKNYVLLDKENETYTIPVKNVITKEGQIDMQLVITEGTNEEEIPVFKSNKFYLFCNSSINAVDEAPDGYDLWIEEANVKLNQVDNLDIDIENSIITIKRKDGTVKSENVKGEKGEKGDAGSVKFIIANELPDTNIDESAIYMKPSINPEAANTYEEYIYVNGNWESLGGATVEVNLEDYFTKEEVKAITGELENLSTEDKSNLVNAINEVFAELGSGIDSMDYKIFPHLTFTVEFFQSVFDAMIEGKRVIVLSDFENSTNNYTYATNMFLSPILTGDLTQFSGTVAFRTPYYLCVRHNISNKTLTNYNEYLYFHFKVSSGKVTNHSMLNEKRYAQHTLPVLTNDNTTEYTPTEDYHPATKKYVDDAIVNAIGTALGGEY